MPELPNVQLKRGGITGARELNDGSGFEFGRFNRLEYLNHSQLSDGSEGRCGDSSFFGEGLVCCGRWSASGGELGDTLVGVAWLSRKVKMIEKFFERCCELGVRCRFREALAR